MTNAALAADHRDRFEGRMFALGEFKLPYRLLMPKGVGASRKYPLVLFFHGAGERGDDNQAQLVHAMNEFAADEIMTKYPAFVVAPQCPAEMRWVEVDWTLERHTMPEQPSPALTASLKLVESLQEEFPIDDRRIYVTGLSMGGFGVWDAMQRRPDLFAAAAMVCAGGDPAFAARMKDIPVWAFHGELDKAVQVQRSREMIAALKATGGMPKYTEYAGVGHDSWSRTYADPALYEWLFAQRKR
jgi:predicted peptidase